jgi:putative ABC transport system permease protein
VTVASPGYFDALGLTLRRGRGFTDADDGRAAPVVLVTEALARRHFPGEDPVGRRIVVGLGRVAPAAAREIVGVVADLRQTGLARTRGRASSCRTARRRPGALTFTLRTSGDPALLTDGSKRELWALNGAMPVAGATTLDQLLSGAVRERRFHLALPRQASRRSRCCWRRSGSTGCSATASASAGTSSGCASPSARGARPDGARAARGGAPRRRRRGHRCGLALAGTGLLRAMLFRVSPFDPLTFGAVTVLVVLVAAGASLVPARRAARADALPALRDS